MKKKNFLKVVGIFMLAVVIGFGMAGCDDGNGNTEETYTLTFDRNGGTGTPPDTRSVKGGNSVTLPNNINGMTKNNAVFGGWKTNTSGMGILYSVGSDFIMPNSDFTLYAQWNDDNSDLVQTGTVTNPDGTTVVTSVNKFEAEPYKGTGTLDDMIKYSYSYDGYDVYYIYLGKMKNIPLFSFDTERHNGKSSTYVVTVTETIKDSTEKTVSESHQTTLDIVNTYTISATIGGKASTEINTGFSAFGVSAEAKVSSEVFWDIVATGSVSILNGQTTSVTDTITHGTERANSTMKSRTWNFDQGYQAGYYRYTFFSASDVYLFVVKDVTKPDEIQYEFREHVIPDVYFWDLDYSETPSFVKNDTTCFEFDVSLLRGIPRPTLLINTVTYHANGASGTVPSAQTVASGTAITLPEKGNMTSGDADFSGWNTHLDGTGTSYVARALFTVTSDISLYAQWEINVIAPTPGGTSGTLGGLTPGGGTSGGVWK